MAKRKTKLTPRELHDCHRWIPLDEIKHLPGNPNQGAPDALSASLQEFGWIDGIVVHNGVVIAGNHRYDQAVAAGEDGLPGYDLSALSLNAARRMAMAIAHNHTTRVGADDPELLAEAMTSIAGVDRGLADVAVGPVVAAQMVGPVDVPDFEPVPIGSQPRLDQRSPVVCPNCGEGFIP